jgi:hypothetical protein
MSVQTAVSLASEAAGEKFAESMAAAVTRMNLRLKCLGRMAAGLAVRMRQGGEIRLSTILRTARTARMSYCVFKQSD